MSGIPFFNKLEIRWFRLFGYGSFARPSFPYLKDGFDGVFFVVHQNDLSGRSISDMRWKFSGTIFSNWVS
jgi:hypothetical protein